MSQDVKFIRKNGRIIPIRRAEGKYGHDVFVGQSKDKKHSIAYTATGKYRQSKETTASERFKDKFKSGASDWAKAGGIAGGFVALASKAKGSKIGYAAKAIGAGAVIGAGAGGILSGAFGAAFGKRRQESYGQETDKDILQKIKKLKNAGRTSV